MRVCPFPGRVASINWPHEGLDGRLQSNPAVAWPMYPTNRIQPAPDLWLLVWAAGGAYPRRPRSTDLSCSELIAAHPHIDPIDRSTQLNSPMRVAPQLRNRAGRRLAQDRFRYALRRRPITDSPDPPPLPRTHKQRSHRPPRHPHARSTSQQCAALAASSAS